jgi:spermidine synthase
MMRAQNWVIDLRTHKLASVYRIKKTLVFTSSRFQEILIVETVGYGKALFLDGVPQSSEADEHIYHEAFVHPAMVIHRAPKKVFVAGGGPGAMLREILRHDAVEKVVMVDIDEEMIGLAKRYLPSWHQGAFENPRVTLRHGDARAFLVNSDEKFDVIYMDCTDPVEHSHAALLFTRESFELAKSQLSAGGIFALQAEQTNLGELSAHISLIKTLKESFKSVVSYQIWIPFFGVPWGFVIASEEPLEPMLSPKSMAQLLQEKGNLDLKFYDLESHLHMFALPKYLRDAIADPSLGVIIHDGDHLVLGGDSDEP